MQHGWLDLCREEGIDPDEVRMVFDRFDAQRKYNEDKREAAIELDRWFRFYRMEKASEGAQAGPAPAGCSVDSDAVNDACIRRPGPFLTVLKAYQAEKKAGDKANGTGDW